jgi:hypothetical protein
MDFNYKKYGVYFMLTEKGKNEISADVERILKTRLPFTECDVLKNDIEQFIFLLIESFCDKEPAQTIAASPNPVRIPNYLRIKLLSREITIQIIDENIKHLNPQLTGHLNYLPPEIYVENKNVFITVLHELIHFYLNYSGHIFAREFSIETICEIFPYFLQQLIIENGIEVIEKIILLGKN